MAIFSRALIFTARRLDNRWGWDRLPRPLGILALAGLRKLYRQRNLYDTRNNITFSFRTSPTTGRARDPATEQEPPDVHVRTIDGSYNDLGDPAMGSTGSRFGRNVPLHHTYPEDDAALLEPNPRLISRKLLTREKFIPATTLNVIAGAWLQFEVHDWFSHGKNDPQKPFAIELDKDDPWPVHPMTIERTRRDSTSELGAGLPPTYVTDDSHWWDGSQIYGNSSRFAEQLRANEGGKLRIDADGLLPKDLEDAIDLSGVAGNFWIGLGVLHTLFTLEHNSICDMLKGQHPGWGDDALYQRARLINAALMAKIHTVEWTPGIIAHPTTRRAMSANWYGLAGERFTKRFGRIGSGEILSGIPGSVTDHHGVPYSLTEEFVAVYRMHPLLPDDFLFRSATRDEVVHELSFREVGALQTRPLLKEMGVASAAYSLGIAHPGAISLHNYPRFLQTFERPDGTVMDLAATDILRVRERGVPRYNEFRRLWHLKPVESFEDLTKDRERAAELRDVYGNVDRLDLMIGLYSEPLPRGFGFSDTAFRVFALMASRRIKSDRFFTSDYRPEVYTQEGLNWIDSTAMKDVLLRHYPQLAPALDGVTNAFTPWKRVRG